MDIRTPLSVVDLTAGLVLGMALLCVAFVATLRSSERWVLVAAVASKVVYCFLFCYFAINVFVGGDMVGYHDHGMLLADRIRGEFPNGLSAYLQDDPFFLLVGSSTARCWSLSGLVHFLVFDSFVCASLVFAMLGLVGQVLIYRTFLGLYPDPRVRNWWRAGILFLPSFNFWSAGILKDTLGVFGLGCAFWGLHAFLSASRLRSLAVMAFGVYTLVLFRSQVAPVLLISSFPLMFGAIRSAAWPAARPPRASRRLISFALVVAVAGFVARSERRFVMSDSILSDFAKERKKYTSQGASSVVSKEEQVGDRGGLALLTYWPEALLLSLYRPYLWEGFTSPIVFLAALENFLFLAVSVRQLVFCVRVSSVLAMARSPVFLECLVFVAVFAFAIGFSTPNMGSISRYRLPMVPYFIGVVTILESLRFERLDRARRRDGRR